MSSIGIDLGTTTTLLAEARTDPGANGASFNIEGKIVPIRQLIYIAGTTKPVEQSYLPSFAFFPVKPPDAGKVFVGVEARTRSALNRDDRGRTIRAVKRLMGRGLVLPAPIGRSPAQVSSLYLKHVLGDARDRGIYSDREELTVTVPASFTSNQRGDTLQALAMAMSELSMRPLDKARIDRVLISEPVAALLDFVAADLKRDEMHRKIEYARNPLVFVYDMGGGTLDLTLVRLGWRDRNQPPTLSNLRFDIDDVSRYNQFAGEDFDLRVADFLLTKLIEKYPELENLTLTDDERRYLRMQLIDDAERLKVELNADIDWNGSSASISFSLSPLGLGTKEYSLDGFTVTYGDYVTWTEIYLQPRQNMKNVMYPIEVFLERNKKEKEDIEYFLGVGGMMHFLPLRDNLKEWWNRPKGWLDHASPSHAVAQGAAVYSQLKAQDPKFVIDEPSADAYYVRRSSGFSLLLGRGAHAQGEKNEYELQGEGESLRLDIFAGDPPPSDGPLDKILPTLIYQGSAAIPLGRTYPKGTKVWIEMSYQQGDGTKVPYITVWVGTEGNKVKEIRITDL
ncbi:MAG: Hsp70 family protein [Chloroflexi bacterium]|nr:Hsp70 family protein [Chloroflexota bacterium]